MFLRRRGKYPVIAISDDGRGMSPDRLREVAKNLFESAKAGDDRTLGEKAIGILAFQQLGGRCDIVSRTADSPDTHVLRLERGKATASLEKERRQARKRQVPGTTIYLSDLDPEVLRMLTQRKVVDYLRTRRGAALANGDYSLEVVEGKNSELVTPEKPEGIKLELRAQNTLWGRIRVRPLRRAPGRAAAAGRHRGPGRNHHRRRPVDARRVGALAVGQRPGLGTDLVPGPPADRREAGRAPRPRRLSRLPRCDRGHRTRCGARHRAAPPRGRRADRRPHGRDRPPGLQQGAPGARRSRQPDAQPDRQRTGFGGIFESPDTEPAGGSGGQRRRGPGA
ncbi:MAG: ATP-binding protein [Acidimicrobiia bacterium]|nr:ATP-binding protein [Acidimicrobiia bacterium]